MQIRIKAKTATILLYILSFGFVLGSSWLLRANVTIFFGVAALMVSYHLLGIVKSIEEHGKHLRMRDSVEQMIKRSENK